MHHVASASSLIILQTDSPLQRSPGPVHGAHAGLLMVGVADRENGRLQAISNNQAQTLGEFMKEIAATQAQALGPCAGREGSYELSQGARQQHEGIINYTVKCLVSLGDGALAGSPSPCG